MGVGTGVDNITGHNGATRLLTVYEVVRVWEYANASLERLCK